LNSTAPASTPYEQCLAVVAQQRKRADLGGIAFIFGELRYLLQGLDQWSQLVIFRTLSERLAAEWSANQKFN
jgi:hypothetical protein